MTPLRLLIAEDSPQDADLIVQELVADGFRVSATRVETLEQVAEALRHARFDAAICDYVMPELTWQRVRVAILEARQDAPLIVVSGRKGEEFAVETIHGGCDDYILKDRLFRLAPALRRALQNAAERARGAEAARARSGLEAQLQKARRLEAIGSLAAAVSHDLNNTLQVLGASLELAYDSAQQGLAPVDDLARAIDGVDRATRLVRQLHSIDNSSALTMSAVDIGRLVDDCARLVQRRAGGHAVTVETQHKHTFPLVRADGSALERTLLNLLLNARDAVQSGGQVMVTVQAEDVSSGGSVASHVRIDVEDNGQGMTADALERAFEPFFTTKADRGGTGLGLASAYQCARGHGGFIRLDSALARGTRASLLFPAAPTEATPEVVPAPPNGHNRRVLLVDHSEANLLVAGEALERAGFRVVTARAPEAAIEHALHAPFDTIVADSVLPNGGGRVLLAQLRARGVTAPVILCSGFRAQSTYAGFAAVVAKPYRAHELVAVVATVAGSDPIQAGS